MSPLRFDAAAFWTFVDDLARLQLQTVHVLFGGVSFRNGSLRRARRKHGQVSCNEPENSQQASLKTVSFLTGSDSMVRRWEANASTARLLKTTPLTTAYQKLLEGSSMTKVTTKSAKKTRDQVMKAHTMPQQSWMNQSCFASLCKLLSTSSSPSSRGRCCSTSLSLWPEDILP